MSSQNIKFYIEIQQFDQITNFDEVDDSRVVRAYYFTSELGKSAARLIEGISSPRSQNAARIITGKRGVGKSHLLTLIQKLATVPRTRQLINHTPQVANSMRRLEGISYVLINLSAEKDSIISFDLGKALRNALKASHNSIEFDDAQWYLAIEAGQICELISSRLFPGMVLLICIDNISEVFRSGKRNIIQKTLQWLSLLSTKSRELPLVVLGVLDEDVLEIQTGQASKLAAEYQIETLVIDNLRRIIDQAIFKKQAIQRAELSSLYREALRHLPLFHWSEQEFIELYPVHPAILEVSTYIATYCESFSLLGFITTVVGRALGRRALQLISLDELFDRFEFEFRKDPRLKHGLEVYDFLAGIIIPNLLSEDRLKAKLILKGIFLYSLGGYLISASDLTNALMLYEEKDPNAGYRQVASILQQLELHASGQLTGQGDVTDRRYLITVLEQVDPEAALNAEAAKLLDNDDRLLALLLTLGGTCFSDWPFSADALLMGNVIQQRHEMNLTWRGTNRKGIVTYKGEIELTPIPKITIEKHEELNSETTLNKFTNISLQLQNNSISNSITDSNSKEVKTIFTYLWEEEWCELDWQLLFSSDPSEDLQSSSTVPSCLFWKSGVIDSNGSNLLKKAWIMYTKGEEILGLEAAEHLQKIEIQVQELFIKLFIEEGIIFSPTGEKISPKNIYSSIPGHKKFSNFIALAVCPILDERFPSHPIFETILTEREVRRLVLGLFGGLNPKDAIVQEYAQSYAKPLHIVIERDGLLQLAVDRDEALSQPAISEILRLVETSTSIDPIPVQVIYQTLRREPYGLLEHTQQLIMMALIAGWRIELIDISGLRIFGAAELSQEISFRQYGTVRRTTAISYSAEVLTEWCRSLTNRSDLLELTAPQGRKQLREALLSWHQNWIQYDLENKFNTLPMEMLTTRIWQLISTCKRYFGTTANAVEAIMHERISLEMGLARIIEIFSSNSTLYKRANHELHLLVDFLNWLPFYIKAKTYILSSPQLLDIKISSKRSELLNFFDYPHRLLDKEKRSLFAKTFQEFQELFIAFYVKKHHEILPKPVDVEKLNEFLSSEKWRTFELLSQLTISNTRYFLLLRELLKKIRNTSCSLFVQNILTIQPYCHCGFRLDQSISFSSMINQLKSLVNQGIIYHRKMLVQYRTKLAQALRLLPSDSFNKEQISILLAISSSDDAVANLPITFGVIELINECLKGETRTIPTSAPAPLILGEQLSKSELKKKLNNWIDQLPDEPNLSFEISEPSLFSKVRM